MMKLKKTDQVILLHGKDRGKKGAILKVLTEESKVVVEKLNMVKRHVKPTQSLPHGGIQEREAPVGIAKVMLVCPHCGKPTRVGHTLADNGKYVRICRKCHQAIDSKK